MPNSCSNLFKLFWKTSAVTLFALKAEIFKSNVREGKSKCQINKMIRSQTIYLFSSVTVCFGLIKYCASMSNDLQFVSAAANVNVLPT